MAQFIPVAPFDLVIFGATGDLSQRKLLPALYHRWLDGQIPTSSRIIGSARTDMDSNSFRSLAKKACQRASTGKLDAKKWAEFEMLLLYHPLDATNPDADWGPMKSDIILQAERPCIYYLATSPRLYVSIAEALGEAGLAPDWARVVLEKPIGTNLETANDINEGVGRVFKENQVFRIDHYLGKETVQNLLVLRFANRLFEPLWSRNAIDHVQITVAENLGLEGRADYYDQSGALRDMVQNHLLQLLCLIAMEPPNSLDADDIRTEKIKVLKALQRIDETNADKLTVRGQYGPGLINGEPVKGYQEELSCREQSNTETFVAVKTEIKNWRWAGVPFYLKTGKRLAERVSDIVIQFKSVPHPLFGETPDFANRLVIRLQPDEGMRLFMMIKEPGPGGLRLKSLPLNLSYAESFDLRYPDAYERLLVEVVRGNLGLFMRRDEVEAAWKWVDGLIDAWSKMDGGPETYAAGSDGPLSSALLMDRDNRQWWKRTP